MTIDEAVREVQLWIKLDVFSVEPRLHEAIGIVLGVAQMAVLQQKEINRLNAELAKRLL